MFRINGKPVQTGRYPDGTPRINISPDSAGAALEWVYEKDEEMLLLFIVKHLQERGCTPITLYMPYIPHARMDRVQSNQEVFTLKHFCGFINALCFDKVIVRDAHSAVSLALLNNVVSEPVEPMILKLIATLLDKEKDIVFYPDEGSRKRYSLGFPYAFGVKSRNWQDGKITGFNVRGEIPQAPFNALIVDDICSYGGTFLRSAQALKALGAEKVYLYVTHCENAVLEGELIKSGLLEKIFTTKSIYTGNHPLIEAAGG
jgi:ribose-phosphate pyrophosphokinase